ncbi:MAG TPA: M15 family metallopeptidase [Gammaproteobacteria bacterium]|nr:M15 family metallopeptidase [Gammaproteobacteria bacterium]
MTGLPDNVKAVLDALGITVDLIASRTLPFHPEASELVIAETDGKAKDYLLIKPAAEAWHAMKASAAADGIILRIFSAFRSIEHQTRIIRGKLEKGISLEDILRVNAPPGYSEHHTGRAIDITTDAVSSLKQEFERTSAFHWLSENAHSFGYSLSFPPNNRFGYMYEPWHWCFA